MAREICWWRSRRPSLKMPVLVVSGTTGGAPMSVRPSVSRVSVRSLGALIVLCAVAFALTGPASAGAAAGDSLFDRAFGYGAGGPFVCTTASGCTSGTAGGAAGQLASPFAVAVSGNEVYVADHDNHRVSV